MASDSNHPFFRPLWRRVAILVVVLAWSLFEWWNGETIWGLMTLAIAAYGFWVFFIQFDANAEAGRQDPPERR